MYRNVFRQAIAAHPTNMQLRLAFIQFESDFDAKSGRKLGKSMLKEAALRNSLELLDCYAQLEYSAGKPSDARKVGL